MVFKESIKHGKRNYNGQCLLSVYYVFVLNILSVLMP